MKYVNSQIFQHVTLSADRHSMEFVSDGALTSFYKQGKLIACQFSCNSGSEIYQIVS